MDRALSMYQDMRAAAPASAMAPTVHTYTAAMRAAAEGGAWERALDVWKDMEAAGCRPSGRTSASTAAAFLLGPNQSWAGLEEGPMPSKVVGINLLSQAR